MDEKVEVREQTCNFLYYHEAHSFAVVTKGLSRRVILIVCPGTEPKI